MSKSIAFTDLRKRQNIRRNNECLHDKKYIQGYHKPLRVLSTLEWMHNILCNIY